MAMGNKIAKNEVGCGPFESGSSFLKLDFLAVRFFSS